MDGAVRVAKDLVNAIKKLQGQELIHPVRHANALMKLLEIFQEKTISLDTTSRAKPQTSISSTRLENLRTTPRVHSRVTKITHHE